MQGMKLARNFIGWCGAAFLLDVGARLLLGKSMFNPPAYALVFPVLMTLVDHFIISRKERRATAA